MTAAALPATGNTAGDARVAEDTGVVYAWNGSSWISPSGSGTVTTVSVVSANGLAGTVANPTSAPAITLSTTVTGILKGNGTAISAAVSGTDYQPAGNYITALTGDVAASGPGSAASTIQANVVSNAKLAQMATHTIKGNNTGGTANALDLSIAQVNTMLGSVTTMGAVGSSPNANAGTITGNTLNLQPFSSTQPGVVSASGGGTTNFLRADGTWAAPGGGGGGLAIGAAVSGGTAFRFLFEDGSVDLADSANFSYDASNLCTVFGSSANAGGGFVGGSTQMNTLFGDSAGRYQGGGGGGGTRCSLYGTQAGANFTAGLSRSSFFGAFSGGGAPNTGGATTQYTSSFGAECLESLTTGIFNSAFGAQALINATTGHDLTACGTFAGQGNVSGAFSIYLGCQTTAADSAESNTLVVGDVFAPVYYAYLGLGSKPRLPASLHSFVMQTTPASGSDASAAASTFALAGAGGTGTGVGGDLIFSVALPGSSGSTINTQTTAMRIKASLAFPLINIAGMPTYANDAAAGVAGLVTGDLYLVTATNVLAAKT